MTARRRLRRPALAVLVALAVPGCGGSGGGSDAASPTADILFPPGACLTSEALVTVRGAAAGDGGVVSVTVNGVVATTTDGFATWTAAVPLVAGNNTLVASVTGANGRVASSADAVTVRRDGPIPQQAADAVFVPSVNAVVFTDPELGVFSTSLATGVRTILSGPGKGSGEPYRALPRSCLFGPIAVQASSSKAFVYDFGRLLVIDLLTGDRDILSDVTHGAGPSLVNQAEALELDVAGNRVFVCRFSGDVQAVDLTTGNRTAVADTVGSGPALLTSDDLAFDATSGLLYVLDAGSRAIVAINPANLGRTTKSSPALGTGTSLPSSSNRLAIDAAGNRAFVLASVTSEIFAVDLATGNRTVVANSFTGTGRNLRAAVDLVWQASPGRLLAPLSTGGVLAVDPTTGNRTLLQETTFAAPTDRVVEDVALSPTGTEVLFVDSGALAPTLVAHTLATGAERIVADDVVGAGPLLDAQATLTYAPNGAAAYAELETQIVRIDLATGDRTVVSSAGVGTGPLALLHDLAAGPQPGTLSALDSTSGLLRIDLATGDRTVVAPVSAFGSMFPSSALTVDPATGRNFVLADDENDHVFEVDPAFPGVASPFASIGLGAPSPFDGDIDGGAFDGRSSALFVVSETWPALFRLDPATDAAGVHSGGGVGAGPYLALRRIDASPARGVLVVGAAGGLVAIDAVSGERVLLLLLPSRTAGSR